MSRASSERPAVSASDRIDSTTSATERLTSIGNRSSGIGLAVSDEQPVLREDQRNPSSATRILSTIRHSSSRLSSPTSQPAV